MNVEIPQEDFWKRVEKTESCWIWKGTKVNGYGRFNVGGKTYKSSHRISWELRFGKIPEGLFVCHKCDNPGCVNPDHLFVGTAKDNRMDFVNKGRHKKVSAEKMTLKQYLDERKETPFQFSKRCFLSFNTVKKLYLGGSVRIDIAKKIVRATKKLVTLEDLGYELRRLS